MVGVEASFAVCCILQYVQVKLFLWKSRPRQCGHCGLPTQLVSQRFTVRICRINCVVTAAYPHSW